MLLRTKVINDLFVVLREIEIKYRRRVCGKTFRAAYLMHMTAKIYGGAHELAEKKARPINSTTYGPHASSITQEYISLYPVMRIEPVSVMNSKAQV